MINPEETVDALNDAKAMYDAGDVSGASTTIASLASDLGAGLDIVVKINAILRYEGHGHGMTKSILKEAITEIERLRAKIEAISQVAGKASIDGVTFAQIKGRDSDVLGKYTPVNDALQKSMEQFQPVIAAKVLNDGE